jgi:hypothetical protein
MKIDRLARFIGLSWIRSNPTKKKRMNMREGVCGVIRREVLAAVLPIKGKVPVLGKVAGLQMSAILGKVPLPAPLVLAPFLAPATINGMSQ